MGVKYLWDTNTVIYYLQQQFSTNADKLMDEIVEDYTIIISAITEIELYCWKTPTDSDLKILHSFVEDALVIELERDIKIKTAEVRKEYRIKLPDAIIAATALVYNLTLITSNKKDFIGIANLSLLDPYEA
ncbi:type II toxin-antitoxin system VapC family toxin [Dyadobacter pollutisoli]|uniref:Type II toxin-antitoxin system VapC family toxin n=1 Tax=Dyadobacter pollutisoli TaxID=2910158 RepID=A0A9E8N791_9BACT|nr:type II toxin-antitoxin system VapC family toxin [Dyadobacter pollutisoli]WAC09832.1 type II toxin-antitoxin system VapC family toxin [Dyadobacter pollutisoli]